MLLCSENSPLTFVAKALRHESPQQLGPDRGMAPDNG